MTLMLSVAVLMAASTPVEAVVAVNREVCVDGQLRLTPARGEVVDSTRMPNIILYSDIEEKRRQVTYIRLKEPSGIFVMIEQFDPSSLSKFETVCKVATRQFTQQDAERAFFDGVANPKYRDNRDSGHPFEPFVIDQPEAGVRKRLFVKGDWMMVETATYKQSQ